MKFAKFLKTHNFKNICERLLSVLLLSKKTKLDLTVFADLNLRLTKIKPFTRGGSRAAATSKMEPFVIIVNGFQPLTIIAKRSILNVAAALDPLLLYNGMYIKTFMFLLSCFFIPILSSPKITKLCFFIHFSELTSKVTNVSAVFL